MCVCVYASGSLTNYIQLSHTVFDAAAIACYTCVPASIVRGDICNEQGAIGHLLEPGRIKWDYYRRLHFKNKLSTKCQQSSTAPRKQRNVCQD